MQYIIESFIIIIILGILVGTALGILVGTGLMLCCMAAPQTVRRMMQEQLKWIHQLQRRKRSECKSDT